MDTFDVCSNEVIAVEFQSIHRQVNANDVGSRRFGDFMAPLSGVRMKVELTNAISRVATDLHRGLPYANT